MVLFLLLTGCFEKFLPGAFIGPYEIIDTSTTIDTCKIGEQVSPRGNGFDDPRPWSVADVATWRVSILEDDDSQFELIQDENLAGDICSIEADGFLCSGQMSVYRNPTDATIYQDFGLSGGWTSRDEAMGTYWWTISCQGRDCAQVALEYGPDFSFPCQTEGLWQASRKGPQKQIPHRLDGPSSLR